MVEVVVFFCRLVLKPAFPGRVWGISNQPTEGVPKTFSNNHGNLRVPPQ